MSSSAPKTSWADDVDELELPKNEEFVDEDGIRTTIEYTLNDEGKKVKITRRIKRTLQKSVVAHAVAERQKWAKFGQEKGSKPGPDRATTTVGENVTLKLSVGNKVPEAEQSPEDGTKNRIKLPGAGNVACRLCKGKHYTAKCPYKDTLGNLENNDTGPDDDTGTGPEPSVPTAATGGKYVPPSMRGAGGVRAPGESMRGPGNRDDLPTLRVTNISEDTQENDLRELFGVFGKVARVYVGRDRETGAGKGFAFVSFDDKATAQKAIDKVNGRGYDNLILSVQWSQPRPDGR